MANWIENKVGADFPKDDTVCWLTVEERGRRKVVLAVRGGSTYDVASQRWYACSEYFACKHIFSLDGCKITHFAPCEVPDLPEIKVGVESK